MWIKTDDFDKQLKKLQRVVQPALFKYVIIQYNHADIKKEIIHFLQATFPDRNLLSIKIRETDYFQLLAKTDTIQQGFVVIEDYEYLINDEAFALGFNQRRDSLSAKNIAYICLIPNDEQVLKKCRELIPDWWSFRSKLFKFEVTFVPNTAENETLKPLEITSLGGFDFATKKDELDWLEEKIQSLSDTEINLKLELLQKSADIAYDLQITEKLLFFCKKLEFYAQNVNLQRLNPLQYARILNSFSSYYDLIGNYEEALNYGNRALELAINQKHNSIISAYQNNIAKIYSNLGDYHKAKELLELSKKLDEKNWGLDSYRTANTYSNLAVILQILGDFEEAKKLLEKSLIISEQNTSGNKPAIETLYTNLALVYKNSGDIEKAKDLLEKVLLLEEKKFGVGHPKTINTCSNLALILKDLGKYEDAQSLLEKVIEADEKNFGREHPLTAIHYSNLALVLVALGKFEGAKRLLNMSYEILLNSLGSKHPYTVTVEEHIKNLDK